MTKPARTGSKSKSNRRLPPDLHVDLYRTMRRIRAFDEKVAELFEGGEIKGTAHSYVGQEAVAAGVCASLGPEDFMASHHRGHGHCIAKGARLDLMMAELMGRESGYCHGLGGSMHIADLGLNILGANGIVGAAMRFRPAPASPPGSTVGPGRGRVLRRRRLQPGRLPRVAQPRLGMEAAHRLHLREQPVRALDLLPRHDLRGSGGGAGLRLRDPPGAPSTATTWWRSTKRSGRPSSAPAPARVRPSSRR